MIAVTLPPSKVHGELKDKIQAIDYYGVVTSASAILLLLIPLSGGGIYFEWSSPMVISMITLGSIMAILFVVVEWKWARMPMMPLHLFKNPAVCAIMIQNILLGIVYYAHLYYLPVYYQNARRFSPLVSAALTIPLVAGQSCISIMSGQYISRTKRYGEIIWSGYALWTLGSGLMLLVNRTTPIWQIAVFLFIEGAGVGNVFQPTLVAAQAHSLKRDRAVVISVRNFLRALGGALGLVISSAVFSHTLSSSIDSASTPLPEDFKKAIMESILSVPDLTVLTSAQSEQVLDSYMAASKAVFTVWLPAMSLCLALCIFIKDKGLQRPEEKPQIPDTDGSGAGESDVEMQRPEVPKT